MTALHVGAERGRFEIVKYLVCKGAGIATKDNAGVSILCNNSDCNFAVDLILLHSIPSYLIVSCFYIHNDFYKSVSV